MSALLKAVGLTKSFSSGGFLFGGKTIRLKAVENVSFEISKGKTMGLVGESGCGKSTLARLCLRLLEADSGEVWLDGENLLELNRKELRNTRKRMQMIFQDPYASLNPRMTAGDTIAEPLYIHNVGSKKERMEKVLDIMDKVGLKAGDLQKYPHEFSGGQRQRIGIGRAIILQPKLIVADEPVSSLDVSIQAQIINLMNDIQQKLSLTYLMISHDLAMVRFICDITAVMYLGQIVETGSTNELFKNPLHPYTEALLSAVPDITIGGEKERMILKGEVPSPIDPPEGCHFHPRCYLYAQTKNSGCKDPQKLKGEKGHMVACHLRS